MPTSRPCLQDFQPFGEAMLFDPYKVYAEARKKAPVFYAPDIDHWVVSRYADVKEIFLDSEHYSAANTLTPIRPLCPDALAALEEGGCRLTPALGNQDRPLHTRFRSNLMRILPPKAMGNEEPRVRRIFRELLDTIRANRRAEMIEDLIFQFPARVVLEVLGFSEIHMPLLIEGGKNRNLLIWGDPTDAEQIRIATGVAQLFRCARQLVNDRKAAPRDDLTSKLVQLDDDEGKPVFSEDEVASVLFAFFTAGHETTASMIGNALRRLLEQPEKWKELLDCPSIIPTVVEECLRFDSAVVSWRRVAKVNVRIAGTAVPAGAQLLLLVGAANRDHQYFDMAHTLALDRKNSRDHLSFGKGVHHCYGNVLARTEIRVALEELARQLPGLRLAAGQAFEFWPNLAFRTLKSLHVEWD